MRTDNIYYKYSEFLKNQYHTKVYKLPVNLPITCPNRIDGKGGCTFCAESGTGFEAMDSQISVTEQLSKTKAFIHRRYKAEKYIAYFQNYTNTFLPMAELQNYLLEAASVSDIVEIDLSTRPDCIREDYLQMIRRFSDETGIHICFELGLQTANYHTLKSINRGHGLAEYIDSCLRIKKYGFSLCTHVILNLPSDNLDDAVETAKLVSVLNNDLVKIHSLYIAKNTAMGQAFLNHDFTICSKEAYYERLGAFLEHLDPNIAVERLFSRIPEKDSLFSNWSTSWWKLLDEFIAYMEENHRYQGRLYNYVNGPALKKFDQSDKY